MAQFDVHRNPGQRSSSIPFVVVIQSAIFDASGRRLVIPLVRASDFGKVEHKRFNPTFKIDHLQVVLQPLEMVSIASRDLGQPVASLTDEGDSIRDAIDELITQAYG